MKYIVFPGAKIGRLTVLEDAGMRLKGGTWRRYYKCQCACGNEVTVVKYSLLAGGTLSCGCLQKDNAPGAKIIHGHTSAGYTSKTYRVWSSMKDRCLNPSIRNYPRYGGRGIKVCDRWLESFEDFLADMGEKPDGLTLDRRDNDGDYTPENCRWATRKEQQNNMIRNHLITYQGRTQTLTQWAEELKINMCTLRSRLELYGWSVSDALTIPVRKKG